MIGGLIATPSRLWAMLRKVEQLFALEQQTREAVEAISVRLSALESRMTYLEAAERTIVTEARSAASAASTAVAGGILSDVVTRLTRAEIGLDAIGRRLPPPA